MSTENQFEVHSTNPTSTAETVVTGFVASGTIRKGSWATFTSPEGSPAIGQIYRIGTGDTPLNVVRKGQKTALVLGVEPHQLRAGMVLSTSEDDVFAPTMLLTAMAPAQRRDLPVPPQDLIDIEVMVNERRFVEALDRLSRRAADPATENVVRRLRARIFLERDDGGHNAEQALLLIRQAYDSGASNDADVIETLARALGENGDSANGLRYLERLYMYALDSDTRDYYQMKIGAFRRRFGIPDQWEVLDALGDVIFSTGDESAIGKAYRLKRFPDRVQVRKNRVGQLMEIEQFAAKSGAVAEKPASSGTGSARIHMGAGAAIGGVAGVIAALALGMSLPELIVIGVAAGCGIGALTGRSRSA